MVPVEVHVPSGEGTLAAYLYVPAGAGPFPGLVLNHGSTIHPGTSDFCRPGTAAVLTAWGYAVLLPHRRGYGNSEGPTWRQEVTAEFGTAEYDRALAARLAREAEDVVAAVDWLGAPARGRADRIGVIGSSFGGADVPPRRRALPPAPLRGGLRRRGHELGADAHPPRDHARGRAAARRADRASSRRRTTTARRRRGSLPPSSCGSASPTRRACSRSFGLTADEGHLFFQNGAPIWGPWVRTFLDRWLEGR